MTIVTLSAAVSRLYVMLSPRNTAVAPHASTSALEKLFGMYR
jgi:hypothetical protein